VGRADQPPFAFAVVDYEPDEVHRVHAHTYTNVSLVLAGGLRERVGGAVVAAGPLSLVVKPAGTEHETIVGAGGARLLWLCLGPELAAAEASRPSLSSWRWLHGASPSRHLLQLVALAAAADGGAGACAEDEVHDLLVSLGGEPVARRPADAPRWLAAARERIDDEFATPIRMRDVARGAGVHPVHLARAFRAFLGCPGSRYLARRRVGAAARMLAEGRAPIAEVAQATGFADQAHLCRTFKDVTGMTPRAFRRLVQA
jgi:AraC family transcriptional regulator